jgi:hypothetical protein
MYFYHFTGMIRLGRFFTSDAQVFGNGEATADGPINSIAGVQALEAGIRQDILRDKPNAKILYLHVNNFILLRTEPSQGAAG